jgi:hypothetical protein
MTFLPGKQADGVYGRHHRTLGTDVADLRSKWEVDDFVLLVEDHELERFGVPDIAAAFADAGIELRRFPIVDMSVPTDANAFRRLIRDIVARLENGRNVVIACRGGLGRTGTVAACTLIAAGMAPGAATAVVRAARHGAIQTPEQEAYVEGYRRVGTENPPDKPLERAEYEAESLMAEHPPQLHDPNKQLVFGIAIPPGSRASGVVGYSRWPAMRLPETTGFGAARPVVEIRDGYFDYAPVLEPGTGVEWHLNFADSQLFGYYGSSLFAQDEMQVAEHPVLASMAIGRRSSGPRPASIRRPSPTSWQSLRQATDTGRTRAKR